MILKIFKIGLVFVFIFLGILTLSIKYVSDNSGQSFWYFPNILINTLQATQNPIKNFLILGVDKRDDWLEKTSVTDTIILVNINSNKVKLISLPRDLWDWQLNQKINQIYPSSLEQPDSYSFIQSNFNRITGQKIDKVLVITTQNLVSLFKIIGGVDIYLDEGFKDEQYPNPEYINNPNSKIPIYVTINFPSGWNHINENNVTEFVRSRKNAQTATLGGTDIGRIHRQQMLFEALFDKLSNPSFYLSDIHRSFNLYRFWYTQIQTNISDQDLFNLSRPFVNNRSTITITKINPPTGENPKIDILYHPKKFINNLWVFLPQEKNYLSLHQFIKQSINE